MDVKIEMSGDYRVIIIEDLMLRMIELFGTIIVHTK
jgi:hypothetical protein